MAEERAGVSPSSIELAESRARDEELGRDDDDADDDDDGYEENAPLVVKRSEVAAAARRIRALVVVARRAHARHAPVRVGRRVRVHHRPHRSSHARSRHRRAPGRPPPRVRRRDDGLLSMARRWSRELLPRPLGRRHALLCVRALSGRATIYAFFCTASYIPLADAAVPAFIAPLVTTVAGAKWLLGELGAPRGSPSPVCLLGALLAVQPTFAFGRGAGTPRRSACSPPPRRRPGRRMLEDHDSRAQRLFSIGRRRP